MKIPCPECGLPVPVDWPAMDATDGAHPAWWRGDDHGVHAACVVLADVLANGHRGAFASPELEALARQLDALRTLYLTGCYTAPTESHTTMPPRKSDG